MAISAVIYILQQQKRKIKKVPVDVNKKGIGIIGRVILIRLCVSNDDDGV